eukprot:TRINITY_DN2296_c0_g1_i4.p1 TRINITY_DN2296_c0_g1~~TRINITY_DN2296_c0_g1_i4.p1  ORF type:complete len:371 (-),score=68.62 TRINITY_DN2296_c0_g1_i4:1463-2575(-)
MAKKKKKKQQPAEAAITQAKLPPLPTSARLEHQLAIAAFQDDNIRSAIRHFTLAIALAADDPVHLHDLFSQRAAVFVRNQDFQRGIEDCTAAICFNGSCEAYARRATLYYLQHRFTSACEDFSTALRLNPSNGLLVMKLQRAQQAQALQRAKTPIDLSQRAFLCVDDTEDLVAQPVPIAEDPLVAMSTLRRLQQTLSRPPVEKQLSSKLIPLIPLCDSRCVVGVVKTDDSLAKREKEQGNEAYVAGKYDAAFRHYSMAIHLSPGEVLFLCNRAAVHLKQKRYLDAIVDATCALSSQACMVKAYARRAQAWRALCAYDLARDDYTQAIEAEGVVAATQPSGRDELLANRKQCVDALEERAKARAAEAKPKR